MMSSCRVGTIGLGFFLMLASSITAGCGVLPVGGSSGTSTSEMVAPMSPQPATNSDVALGSGGSAQSADAAREPEATVQGTLVVSTAAINIEVKDLDAGVDAIRALAAKYGASIANLSTSAGNPTAPGPEQPYSASGQYSAPTPGGATITLRIPSAKLSAAEREISTLGRVISQSSSQDDVTQQHVDMGARLKNLKAEESRLRTFFAKANRVSEMLAIEQELARVRGDIESMQAQITYLERQAALATLTISLSQPGALVSPAAGGWGFSDAIRTGIRAAAAVLRGLITIVLALSPLVLVGIAIYFLIRAIVRRRRNRRAHATGSSEIPSGIESAPETGAYTDQRN